MYTGRLEVLAAAKQTPPGFIEDRRSVYWVDKQPPLSISNYDSCKYILVVIIGYLWARGHIFTKSTFFRGK